MQSNAVTNFEQGTMNMRPDSASLDLQHYWRIFRNAIRKYYMSILAIAALCMALANIFIQSLTPIYTASAQLHIQDRRSGLDINQLLFEWRDPAFQETQIAILTSRELLFEVAKRLEANKPEEQNSQANNPARSPGTPTFADDIKNWFKELMGTPSLQPKQIPTLTEEEALIQKTNELKGKISVQPLGDSYLVNLIVTDVKAQRAADIANALAEVYIESNYNRDLQQTLKTQEILTDRLKDQREELRVAERALQEFRGQENLLGSALDSAMADSEINNISSALLNARKQRIAAKNLYDQVVRAQQNGSNFLSIPMIASQETVQGLSRELFDLERQKNELSKRYGPKHNKMIAISSDISSTRRELETQLRAAAESIKNDYIVADQNEQSLSRELEDTRRGQQRDTSAETRLRELEADVESKREIYHLVLSLFNTQNATANIENSSIRITDRAIVPQHASESSKKQLLIVLSFFGGFFGSLALAILAEMLDANINTPNDVELKLGIETLGTLPDIETLQKSKKSKTTNENIAYGHYSLNQNSNYSESVRTIRTSLILSSLDRTAKILLVTSSVPSEGKTSLAINLASSFAESEKVLLIDTDLRRPSIERALGQKVHQHLGLTDLVAGTNKFEECITRDTENNLDLLTSGSFTTRPLDVLGSERFAKLIEKLSQRYDRIILDSAPCAPVSDAMILSRLIDGLLFVVKAGKTPIPQARRSLLKLQRVGAPISGVVLNKIDETAAYYEYEYYGHGYEPITPESESVKS